jgi:hypothetical protein
MGGAGRYTPAAAQRGPAWPQVSGGFPVSAASLPLPRSCPPILRLSRFPLLYLCPPVLFLRPPLLFLPSASPASLSSPSSSLPLPFTSAPHYNSDVLPPTPAEVARQYRSVVRDGEWTVGLFDMWRPKVYTSCVLTYISAVGVALPSLLKPMFFFSFLVENPLFSFIVAIVFIEPFYDCSTPVMYMSQRTGHRHQARRARPLLEQLQPDHPTAAHPASLGVGECFHTAILSPLWHRRNKAILQVGKISKNAGPRAESLKLVIMSVYLME